MSHERTSVKWLHYVSSLSYSFKLFPMRPINPTWCHYHLDSTRLQQCQPDSSPTQSSCRYRCHPQSYPRTVAVAFYRSADDAASVFRCETIAEPLHFQSHHCCCCCSNSFRMNQLHSHWNRCSKWKRNLDQRSSVNKRIKWGMRMGIAKHNLLTLLVFGLTLSLCSGLSLLLKTVVLGSKPAKPNSPELVFSGLLFGSFSNNQFQLLFTGERLGHMGPYRLCMAAPLGTS